MAPRQWLPRPVVTTSFPPVIQLVEPKKLTSRTTSIPHLFLLLLIRLSFHLTTLSRLVTLSLLPPLFELSPSQGRR